MNGEHTGTNAVKRGGNPLGSMPSYDWPRLDREKRISERDAGNCAGTTVKALSTHEVAYAQAGLTRFARERLFGAGEDQYVRGGVQKFQGMSDAQLVQDIKEEIADTINYLTFIYINIAQRHGLL